MNKDKMPTPRELEKELNEYLSKKYGEHVRLSVPFLFPISGLKLVRVTIGDPFLPSKTTFDGSRV